MSVMERHRYIIPPHSARMGTPRSAARATLRRMEALAASSPANRSGNPPPRITPSASGSASSCMGLKGISSAPRSSRADRLSG